MSEDPKKRHPFLVFLLFLTATDPELVRKHRSFFSEVAAYIAGGLIIISAIFAGYNFHRYIFEATESQTEALIWALSAAIFILLIEASVHVITGGKAKIVAYVMRIMAMLTITDHTSDVVRVALANKFIVQEQKRANARKKLELQAPIDSVKATTDAELQKLGGDLQAIEKRIEDYNALQWAVSPAERNRYMALRRQSEAEARVVRQRIADMSEHLATKLNRSQSAASILDPTIDSSFIGRSIEYERLLNHRDAEVRKAVQKKDRGARLIYTFFEIMPLIMASLISYSLHRRMQRTQDAVEYDRHRRYWVLRYRMLVEQLTALYRQSGGQTATRVLELFQQMKDFFNKH